MDKDLLQGKFVLTPKEKITVMGELNILHNEHPYCSACGSAVDITFLRKHHDSPIHAAMCLPCFLNNYTDEAREDIDRMVEIADSQGWYK